MTTTNRPGEAELRETVKAFDEAFARGDAAGLTAYFTPDARILMHGRLPIVGHEAILANYQWLFSEVDTSRYTCRYDEVDVDGERAYFLGEFSEDYYPHKGGAGLHVDGRIVHCWRREGGGSWRCTWLLTARVADRPIPAA